MTAEEALVAYLDKWDKESRDTMRELAKKYHIKDLDEDVCLELSGVRRPLILVRGKPITREQTIQLIAGEEPLFGEGSDCKGHCIDWRGYSGVLENIFYRGVCGLLSTWVYSDGTIGGNLTCGVKYPELDEYLPRYMHLAKKYPFLDMVVSFTIINECCCWLCNMLNSDEKWDRWTETHPGLVKGLREFCECRDCEPYLDKIRYYNEVKYNPNAEFDELYYRKWDTCHVRSDVKNFVRLTIWIHNGETEVLFGDKAITKFNEYNSLYCAPEYALMFTDALFWGNKICICDKEFVEDCFEYIGKPRSLCDEYVEKGFISPFNEEAVVVTKEWVIEQYNTYIAKK